MLGVIGMKEKHTIIKLKEEGNSNRSVQRMTGIDRKTVAKYWNDHQTEIAMLGLTEELRAVQERIVSAPAYDVSKRSPLKYTPEIDEMLDKILAGEEAKIAVLGGSHRQKLTGVQIHGMIKAAGHDIGLTVICDHIKEKRGYKKETFIKQEYEYGQRLEYDFGEVRLVIGGIVAKYYMAVFSSPRAGFRWAYLYRNQKKDVFLESHARFFEMAGGVYNEVVYDNMKNVVTRFIGRSEKQLNEDLIKMSLYYGFNINVTNCFKGNEKGHVESSVKNIRNKVFAPRYSFGSFKEAEVYLYEKLCDMNKKSTFEEEKRHLKPYRPPLELAQISEQAVDKYSFIRVENHFYSVPEYLVGRKVTIKNYQSEVLVFSNGNKVCSHKKEEGFLGATVEITHYLDTFMRKPGALKNSVALKGKKELKAIYDKYFTGREREFIVALKENSDKELPEVINALMTASSNLGLIKTNAIEDNVTVNTRSQIAELSKLFMVYGGDGYAH